MPAVLQPLSLSRGKAARRVEGQADRHRRYDQEQLIMEQLEAALS